MNLGESEGHIPEIIEVKRRCLLEFSGKEVVLPLENVGKPWARK
jgi:hypothetical protein